MLPCPFSVRVVSSRRVNYRTPPWRPVPRSTRTTSDVWAWRSSSRRECRRPSQSVWGLDLWACSRADRILSHRSRTEKRNWKKNCFHNSDTGMKDCLEESRVHLYILPAREYIFDKSLSHRRRFQSVLTESRAQTLRVRLLLALEEALGQYLQFEVLLLSDG